jgi:LPS sulfotransferase NodH
MISRPFRQIENVIYGDVNHTAIFNPTKIDTKHNDLLEKVAVIIPAKFDKGTARETAYHRVIDFLLWSGFKDSQIITVKPLKGEDFNKGELITRGVKRKAAKDKNYIIQVDADIFTNWGGFFDWIAGGKYKNPCLLFMGFLRLDREQTEEIFKTFPESKEIPINKHNTLRARCAGGFWITKELYLKEPVKEVFVGWGCEDIEFANRIHKNFKQWERFNEWGIHHWHEFDRRMNLDNLKHSTQKNKEKLDWNKLRQKLVILCPRRSGSNLLERSLDTHPDLEMFHGEPFGVTACSIETKENTAPINWILSKVKTDANTFGFRLMDHDPTHIAREPLLEQLKNHNFNFIRLHRENLFNQLSSFWLASTEQNWIDKEYETQKTVMCPIWAEKQVKLIRKYQAANTEFLSQLDPKQYRVISYENMVSNFEETMNEIQDFLGLRIVSISPNKKKQMKKEPEEIITNFEEIKKLL